MQAADFLSVLPMPGAAPSQGGARGQDGVNALDGLFAPAEGEGAGGLFGDAAFAEALMAAMGLGQPLAPIAAAPTPVEGEAAPAEGVAMRAATPAPVISLLQAPVGMDVDAAAAAAAPEGATAEIAVPAAPTLNTAPVAAEPAKAEPTTTAARATGPVDAEAEAAALIASAVTGQAAPKGEKVAAPVLPQAPLAPQAPVAPQAPAAATAPVADAAPAAPVVAPQQAQAEAAPVPAPPAPAAPTQAQPTAHATAKAAEDGKAQGRTKTEIAPAQNTERKAEANAAAPSNAAAAPEETLTRTAVTATAAAADTDEQPAFHEAEAPVIPGHLHTEAKAQVQAPLMEQPRATPQTVALLSAQIAKSAEAGKSTRIEVQLNPEGLGKVDVKVEIKANGDIRAELSFENPIAASELRARSGELQTALERAGFDSSKTQLSFNSGSQNQNGQFAQNFWNNQQQQQHQQNQQQQASWKGAAFMDLGDALINPSLAYSATERDGGVDVRI